MPAPRGIRNSTRENRDTLIRYITKHGGTDKTSMIAGTGLTVHQVNSALINLRDEVHTELRGRGRGRTGTYYIKTVTLFVAGKIANARVVRAGEILRRKYNYRSPELKKSAQNTIKSAMD